MSMSRTNGSTTLGPVHAKSGKLRTRPANRSTRLLGFSNGGPVVIFSFLGFFKARSKAKPGDIAATSLALESREQVDRVLLQARRLEALIEDIKKDRNFTDVV